MSADAKAFWNAKILGWEDSRYAAAPGLFGRVASSSLRFRLDIASRLLAPHVVGRRVVEIGCGSGLLAERLLALGAASYQGYDLAEVAIRRARERAPREARFDVAAVADLASQGDALVISLGLVDWLTLADCDRLFALGRDGACLHAVSERRRSPTQLLHRAYVHCAYGRETGFAPRYCDLAEIEACAARQGVGPLHVFRHRRLRFGVFVSDLAL
jgi:SAM-dependent methyltransferase